MDVLFWVTGTRGRGSRFDGRVDGVQEELILYRGVFGYCELASKERSIVLKDGTEFVPVRVLEVGFVVKEKGGGGGVNGDS